MQRNTATPKADGFAMPAEWSRHERTWMMWPCREEIWPSLCCTQRAYVAVARAIRLFEPVTMIVNPQDEDEARTLLGPAIDVLAMPIDDSWARDCGPCFLLNGRGELAGTSFRFNAWGAEYPDFERDDALSGNVLERQGCREYVSGLIAEGGGVNVDGEGTILTTESCFPNANRNPDWSRDEIEAELKDMLGGEKVIWLPGNPLEEETNGHVDLIASFARPGVVLVDGPGDPGHAEYDIRLANIAALKGQTDARGRPLELIEIDGAYEAQVVGERFSLSYINSYFVNGGIIMPSYGTASDRTAFDTFSRVFPDRTVVPVAINDIAVGGGGIHCITQQQPASTP